MEKTVFEGVYNKFLEDCDRMIKENGDDVINSRNPLEFHIVYDEDNAQWDCEAAFLCKDGEKVVTIHLIETMESICILNSKKYSDLLDYLK